LRKHVSFGLARCNKWRGTQGGSPSYRAGGRTYRLDSRTGRSSGGRQSADARRHPDDGPVVVPNLSPRDIVDLATYYFAIEISVGKIPG